MHTSYCLLHRDLQSNLRDEEAAAATVVCGELRLLHGPVALLLGCGQELPFWPRFFFLLKSPKHLNNRAMCCREEPHLCTTHHQDNIQWSQFPLQLAVLVSSRRTFSPNTTAWWFHLSGSGNEVIAAAVRVEQSESVRHSQSELWGVV